MASSPADSCSSVGETTSPSNGASMGDSPSLGRRRSAPSEADPLADILSKLGLGDGGTIVSKKDEEGVIAVLMEVLFIPHDQAQFFLESANNDVAGK